MYRCPCGQTGICKQGHERWQEARLHQEPGPVCQTVQNLETALLAWGERLGRLALRQVIGGGIDDLQGILFIAPHRLPQLPVQLGAVYDQHQLCVQIGAAHVPVEGAHGGDAVVDGEALPVIGDTAVILQHGDAAVQQLFLIDGVVHGPEGIAVVGHGIGHHGDLRHAGADIRQLIQHPVIAEDVGGMDGHGLFRLLHQLRDGMEDQRLLDLGADWI